MPTATACPASPAPRHGWRRLFLKWLPRFKTAAAIAFRNVRGQDRDDLIAETIANAYVAMAGLAERRALNLAFPSVLSRFSIAQVKDGRCVGNRSNVREVLSEYAQTQKAFTVNRLDVLDTTAGEWQEVLVEDRRAGPADLVQTKLDFADFLRSLPVRYRRIAKFLAKGETTTAASKKFACSPGRISQIRAELKQAWDRHVGNALAPRPSQSEPAIVPAGP